MKRGCGYLIDCCGNKDLAEYTRSDATKFRDYLFNKGLNGASVARIFGTVRAVINLALSEFGLSITKIELLNSKLYDGAWRSIACNQKDPIKVLRIKGVFKKRLRIMTSFLIIH